MKVTLTGENSFSLQVELDRFIKQFLDEHGELALERLDGEEASFEQMQEALQSLPFLASKKMVVLRTPSANKQFAENAERLLADLPESTDVILLEPKLDKRLSYYKLLKKATDYHDFAALDRMGLSGWLVSAAKAREGQLSIPDAQYLVDRVGPNQQLLSNELDKLLLYDSKVTRTDIELLTEATPQSSIFELLETAFAGNSKRVMALYAEQRTMKTEPPQIIAMIAWQLHLLALIKTAGDRTPDQIAREAKVNPYVVRKSSTVARQLTLPRLKQLIADLLAIDTRLKRENIDPDEAILDYLIVVASG